MKNTLAPAALGLAVLLFTGCTAEQEDPEPTATATEIETVEAPEPEAQGIAGGVEGSGTAEDEWLDDLWDNHVEGITDWWDEYHLQEECPPERAECYDVFEAGFKPMEGFRDATSETDSRKPSYAGVEFQAELSMTVYEFSLWRVSCSFNMETCEEDAAVAYDAISGTLDEVLSWYE